MDKKTVLYNYCQCLSPPSHPFGLNSLIAFLTPICQMSFQFVQVGSAALRMCCFLENFLPLSPHFFGVFICFLKGTTLVSCKICLYFSEIKVNLPKSENNNSIWLNSCDLQGKKNGTNVRRVMICGNLQEALVLGPGVLLLTITQILFLCNYPSNNREQAKIIEAIFAQRFLCSTLFESKWLSLVFSFL